ncbi:cytosine permease [Aestuariivivens insulae]|uniref:cytosine permease n=1 Tax=Aestuariivivens insulae TaxID=1621988 RepID=UPI001F5A6FC2|nr:cytosine permease [Aestuariivivens insulae]
MENNVKWHSLAGIWFGGIVSVPALLVGSVLINSLSFYNAILAGFLGFSFVVAFMCILSVFSFQKRMATVSLSSKGFGQLGANYIVGLVIGLSTLGWFGVQTSIAGASFSRIFAEMNGIDIPIWLSSIFWGTIMVLTAVFGFKYLKWLNYIAVPAIVLLLVYGLVITFKSHDFSEIIKYNPKEKISILQAMGVTIGFIVVGGVISPDYNRFAKSKKDAVLGSIIGVIIPAMLLLVIGAILALTQDTHDIVEVFSSLGFPFFAMSILILATWTSNVMNIYSSGLAFTNLLNLKSHSRAKVTLALGLLGVSLSVIGILNHFIGFITLLTVTITPIAGVIIAAQLAGNSGKYTSKKFNWAGIISWLIGVALMLLTNSNLKYIIGLVTAGIVFLIINKIVENYNEKNQ